MADKDLVVVSLETWDEVWRRNQHLVAGLMHRDPELRVLFVEPAPDPLHDVSRRQRPTVGHGVRTVPLEGAEGRLFSFRPTKWLPRKVDPRVDVRLANLIVAAVRSLGMTRPVLWLNDPNRADVLRQTGWPALYDITDDWLEAERPALEHARLVVNEGYLMSHCAEVVVCSPTLAASKGAIRPVELVPNAVDVDDYRHPRPRPVDLPAGSNAVYVGTIHRDRIDVDLCVATARALEGMGHVVLVGPALLSDEDLAGLRAAGVVVLGSKPKDQVPGYLQHADVLLVPHVVTPFTMSLDPIKRYEYAAVGRPVVSTPVTGFVDVQDTRVTVAEPPEFAEAVRDRIPAGTVFPDGVSHDVPGWADRVASMERLMEQMRLAIELVD